MSNLPPNLEWMLQSPQVTRISLRREALVGPFYGPVYCWRSPCWTTSGRREAAATSVSAGVDHAACRHAAWASRASDRQGRAAAVESDDPGMTEMASHLVRAGQALRPLLAAPLHRRGAGSSVGDDVVERRWPASWSTGSLHHDDVIDEAPTRHRVDSVNARWGNLRAILSGDFLLPLGAGGLLGTEVAGLLGATIARLCEGQVRELQFAYHLGAPRPTTRRPSRARRRPCSPRPAASARGGRGPRPEVDALTEFGLRYGLAFQVVDDVLDVVATGTTWASPAGHDMAEAGPHAAGAAQLADPGRAGELRSLLRRPLGRRTRPGRWSWCGRATAGRPGRRRARLGGRGRGRPGRAAAVAGGRDTLAAGAPGGPRSRGSTCGRTRARAALRKAGR